MNTTRSEATSKLKHPDAPGLSGVYPVKKDKPEVIWHVAGNELEDQPVKRFQIPLVPTLFFFSLH
jgi:hypothetical protein